MGQDKAFLEYHGTSLIIHIARMVEKVAGSTTIIGPPERYSHLGWRVIVDRRTNSGPLAGIETGLLNSTMDRNLFVACDMPGLQPELLTQLLTARAAPCVIPKTPDGRLHPLCAVWDCSLLPRVQQVLDQGKLKVLSALEDIDLEEVEVPVLGNANTPEEWRTLTA